MDTGNEKVVGSLETLLADSYTLYVKTHGYHWNVTGPMFGSLHVMFEDQYSELALAVDEIAERIRALGAPAPGSYSQFAALTSIEEDTTVPKALDMVGALVADHEMVAASARSVVRAAEDAGDDATVDLGVRRIDVHDKTAWMLRSHLE
ncbi:MAG TPA: Dps family protein [Acidimicrobiia bacterium]|nr:Dps family protein [Acidimicrobiia bacterium]